MKKTFKIGEISSFFNIPSATLRFWDEAGVITPRKNNENHYREYTLPDLMKISDIIFYKSLGIKLKQISEIEESELSYQHSICDEQMEELIKQKKLLEFRMQKLKLHKKALLEIERLKNNSFRFEKIDTKKIVSFELTEREKLHKYITNPYLYSRVQHSNNLSIEYRGITVDDNFIVNEKEVLWEYKNSTYISCLMKEEIIEDFPNNLSDIVCKIQQQYKTGNIISRFLACGSENGKCYDFYKVYVEII
ncbi:MerR family transcriptional regulator [Clostridioides difficile]